MQDTRQEQLTGDASIRRWREQLRKGGLDLAILLALRRRERYGLEILRYLESEAGLEVSGGTLYPLLARLSKAGALAARWEADESPHPRKYYSITDEGRMALAAMLDHWRRFRCRIDRLIEHSAKEEA